jgi:hypothetical protein
LGTSYLDYVATVSAKAEEGEVTNPLCPKCWAKPRRNRRRGRTGILERLAEHAAANGYRTGLVTTGDAATAASLFYNVAGDNTTVASTLVKTPNSISSAAAVARTSFQNDSGFKAHRRHERFQRVGRQGRNALFNAEAVEDSTLEIKGKTLALQGDDSLSYAADQIPNAAPVWAIWPVLPFKHWLEKKATRRLCWSFMTTCWPKPRARKIHRPSSGKSAN